MPNWCYSEYAFTGPKIALEDLHEKINRYTSKPRYDGSEVKHYCFGRFWLSNIVGGFGLDPEQERCRGEVFDINLTDEALFVSTETAWSPMPTMWENILEKHYADDNGVPYVSFVFAAEEPGMCIYVNTDTEHWFFREKYLLSDNNKIQEYVNADEVAEICDWLRVTYHLEGENLEELVTAYNAKGPKDHLFLHEFISE